MIKLDKYYLKDMRRFFDNFIEVWDENDDITKYKLVELDFDTGDYCSVKGHYHFRIIIEDQEGNRYKATNTCDHPDEGVIPYGNDEYFEFHEIDRNQEPIRHSTYYSEYEIEKIVQYISDNDLDLYDALEKALRGDESLKKYV